MLLSSIILVVPPGGAAAPEGSHGFFVGAASASANLMPRLPGCHLQGCSAPGAVVGFPRLQAVVPTAARLGSTPTNRLVSNWSGEGMIVENPADPNNLVAGGLYQAPSAYNSSVYYSSGVSGVSTSVDGGQNWSTQTLPASPMWRNASSPQCGHIHLADTAIAFGPNDTVYYADLSYSASPAGVVCNGPFAGIGLYCTVSHDGGLSWDTPVGVAAMNAGGSVDKPWLAVDQRNGYVYVAYTDDANGTQLTFQRSVDEGAHWSAPKDISASGGSGDNMLGAELAVDTWGGVDATWIDLTTDQILFTRSTDHGGNFSNVRTIATASAGSATPAPDAFRAITLPGFTVGANGSNGFTSRLFSVWQNGSGGTAGTPAISLSYSSNNGTTWSAPHLVNSNMNLENFQPDVAVAKDGTVFVDWYGENPTDGTYRLYGSVSRDGGSHFDPQFAVSEANSLPQYSGSGGGDAWWIGDYTDIEAGARGAWTLWTDARSGLAWGCSPCLWGYDYNISFYAALLTNATFLSTSPVNLSVNGTVPGPATLPASATPRYRDWIGGEAYNLTAPAETNSTGPPSYFALWFGSNISTNLSLSGTVRGPLKFTACYVATPGAACHAPGAPGHLDLASSPVNSTVTINGASVALGPSGRASFWESPGVYRIHASSPGHYDANRTVSITPGNTSWANLSLRWIPGSLSGRVTPANATVTVRPAGNLSERPDGTFNATLVPGRYTIEATLFRYGPSWANVTIAELRNTTVNLTLPPLPGWINGTVHPSSARVSINGVPGAVSPSGVFSFLRPPGVYFINATSPGYVTQRSGPVSIGPFGSANLPLWLPLATGLIVVNRSEPSTRVWVNYTELAVSNGSFRVSLVPGQYFVQATSPGWQPWNGLENVVYNRTTFVQVQFVSALGWIDAVSSVRGALTEITAPSFAFHAHTPFNIAVPAGTYTLNTTMAGYHPESLQVVVRPAEVSHVAINLSELTTSSLIPSPVSIALVVFVVVAGVAAFVLFRRRGRSRGPGGERPRNRTPDEGPETLQRPP
ncbi:MAG: PEGA domain-containing protein [Thermoplasmata archaeon]|nr:PEGA domain-containing protein [Thermoplasmata archaeon]